MVGGDGPWKIVQKQKRGKKIADSRRNQVPTTFNAKRITGGSWFALLVDENLEGTYTDVHNNYEEGGVSRKGEAVIGNNIMVERESQKNKDTMLEDERLDGDKNDAIIELTQKMEDINITPNEVLANPETVLEYINGNKGNNNTIIGRKVNGNGIVGYRRIMNLKIQSWQHVESKSFAFNVCG